MQRLLLIASACLLASTTWLGAQDASRSYDWYAELVSVDQTAKTITVKALAREALNRYVGEYAAGDSLMLVWVPIEGEADTIVYAPAYEVMADIDEGYILPATFVSADEMGHTITVTIPVPDTVLSAVGGLDPGQWVKVTTPMRQPSDTPMLASAVAAARPDLKLPEPEPEPERAEINLPEGTGGPAAGRWALRASFFGMPINQDCTFAQDYTELIGVCQSDMGDVDVTGTVNGDDIAFSFSTEIQGNALSFEYAGTLDGDEMSGTLMVFGMSTMFTATRTE